MKPQARNENFTVGLSPDSQTRLYFMDPTNPRIPNVTKGVRSDVLLASKKFDPENLVGCILEPAKTIVREKARETAIPLRVKFKRGKYLSSSGAGEIWTILE